MTEKQKIILDFIKKYYYENNVIPTYEKIGSELSRGRSVISKHVHALIEEGYLVKQFGRPAYRLEDPNIADDVININGKLIAANNRIIELELIIREMVFIGKRVDISKGG